VGLGWLLDPKVLASTAGQGWPDLGAELVPATLVEVQPLVRALLTAGYETFQVDVVRLGGIPEVLSIDDASQAVAPGSVPAIYPLPSAGGGVVLHCADLIHTTAMEAAAAGAWLDPRAGDPAVDLRAAFSHAIAVPASAEGPWTGITPGVGRQVVLWSAAEVGSDPWVEEISTSVTGITNDIAAALTERIEAGTLTPLARAGLLWLVNPLFWFPLDPTYPGSGFDADLIVVEPAPAWPAVTSASAQTLDPVGVYGAQPPPDPNWRELVRVAAFVAPGLLGYPGFMLERLFHHDPMTRGNLTSLLTASRVTTAETLGRQAAAAVSAIAGKTVGATVSTTDWLQVLLALAETAVIAPAGYPDGSGDIGTAPDTGGAMEFVNPVWNSSAEVVLELARTSFDGPAPATIVVQATALCQTSIDKAFVWDYLGYSDIRRLPKVIVLAGPGVQIVPDARLGELYDMEILRVWDYESLPLPGSRIQPELHLVPFVEAWTPTDTAAYLEEFVLAEPKTVPLYGVKVYPLPDGIALEYPAPRTAQDPPAWRIVATVQDAQSGNTRITYDAVFGRRSTSDIAPLGDPSGLALSLWVSSGVTVLWEELGPAPSWLLYAEPQVWRIPDAADIPLQGSTLPFFPQAGPVLAVAAEAGPPLPTPSVPLPHPATQVTFPEPPDPDDDGYGKFSPLLDVVDVLVGAIPIVGDLVDAAELGQSLVTHTDRWGRPVTAYQQAFMLFGCLVPFVSSSALRSASRGADDVVGYAVAVARDMNVPLLRYLDAIISASPSELRLLRELALQSPSFRRFSPAWQRKVIDGLAELAQFEPLARRLGEEAGTGLIEDSFHLIDLLGPSGVHPWLPSLLNPYRRYLRTHGLTPSIENLMKWLENTEGPPKAIIEALITEPAFRSVRKGDLAVVPPKLSSRFPDFADMVFLRTAKSADYYGATGLGAVLDAGERLVLDADSGRRVVQFATQDQLTALLPHLETLLRGVSPTGGLDALDPALVRTLMGRRTLGEADMAEMLMRSLHIIDGHTRQISDAVADGGTHLGMDVGTFLRLRGHRSAIADMVTQSGYKQGPGLEVITAIEEWARRTLAHPTDDPADFMTLQEIISGLKGADLTREFEGMIQLVDSKAVINLATSLKSQKAIAAQALRWVNLIKARILRPTLPNGAKLPTHPEVWFRVDSTMYIEAESTVNGVIDRTLFGPSRYKFVQLTHEFEAALNDQLRAAGVKVGGKFVSVRIIEEPMYHFPG